MLNERLLVGRQREMDYFFKRLEYSYGQAMLIEGHQGMGKSFLGRHLLQLAEMRAHLKCHCFSYQVTQNDQVDTLMEVILDQSCRTTEQKTSFSGTQHQREQWRALIKAIPAVGSSLAELIQALERRQVKRFVRDHLLEALEILSCHLKEDQRLIFFIDSAQYMPEGSADPWNIVVGRLPERIILLFAQRPDDELASSNTFKLLDNVSRVPPKERLGPLEQGEIDVLINLCSDLHPIKELRKAIDRYGGHPFAVSAAIDLILEGVPLTELGGDPAGVAAEQWRRVCSKGSSAIRLIEAFAVLDEPVPRSIASQVAELDSATIQNILSDSFMDGLLPADGRGWRQLYHSFFESHVLKQLDDNGYKYNKQAAAVFNDILNKEKNNALSARRLPIHLLAAEGVAAFSDCVVQKSVEKLRAIGLESEALGLLNQAEILVGEDRGRRAWISVRQAEIFLNSGDFEKAENVIQSAIVDAEKKKDRRCLATCLNLSGLVARTTNKISSAIKYHERALGIFEELEDRRGVAHQYGNLAILHQLSKIPDLAKSKELLERSYDIYNSLTDIRGMARVKSGLGNLYKDLSDLEAAERSFKESLEMHRAIDDRQGIADQEGNLGEIYKERGDLEVASKSFERALDLHRSVKNAIGMALDYRNLGEVAFLVGDLKNGYHYSEESLKIFRRLRFARQVEEIEGCLNKIH